MNWLQHWKGELARHDLPSLRACVQAAIERLDDMQPDPDLEPDADGEPDADAEPDGPCIMGFSLR